MKCDFKKPDYNKKVKSIKSFIKKDQIELKQLLSSLNNAVKGTEIKAKKWIND